MNWVDWEYVRGQAEDLARLAGFTVLVILAVIGACTVASWCGI